MISGERKKFGLVPRRSVANKHECVANTGQLHYDGNVQPFRFSFAEDFVSFVGMMLPAGVSKFHPAYVFVVQEQDRWTVWAAYVEDNKNPVALWRTTTQPTWIPEIANVHTETNRQPSRRERSTGHDLNRLALA